MKYYVANGLTALNLVFGTLAIFFAIDKEFVVAGWCIIFAVIADILDGRAARYLGTSGPFGQELDSLCDLGSFGVAPAIMVYQYGLTNTGMLGKFVVIAFAVCGALRLARFNVNISTVCGYFMGIPIPAAGLVLSTYIMSGLVLSPWILLPLILMVAYLMVSSIKFPDFKGKGNPIKFPPMILVILIGISLLYSIPHAWLFVIMFTYCLLGGVNHLYCKFK